MRQHRSPVTAGTNVISIDGTKVKQKSSIGDRFFAVCPDAIARFTAKDRLVDLLVFMILACGTGKDHETTAWSAQSVSRRLAIGWPAADAAIGRLVAAGRLESLLPVGKKPNPKTPSYRLQLNDDHTRRIWLPMTLIEGTDKGETPPIQVLRQMGEIGPALALLQCYAHLDMPGCGGVDIGKVCWTAERIRKVTRSDACWIWEWSFDYTAHLADDFARQQFDFGDMKALEDAGLLRWVDHLRDGGEDGGTLSPYDFGEKAEPLERKLTDKIDNLTHHHFRTSDGIVRWVAMPAHISNPQIVQVARPRYLPRTEPVKAWYCKLDAAAHFAHPFWSANAAGVAA